MQALPCPTSTSTCRSFETISSGLCRLVAIVDPPFPIIDGGQIQWGRITGVGAFAHAKEKLDAFELSEPLIDYASNGGYLLGICLGMQLLFSRSFEYGTHEGLNVIQGDVDCIKNRASTIRVPLIGWHPLHGVKDSNLFNNIDEQNYYFVHSFECLPKDDQLLSSYVLIDNLKICSSVSQGNISGVQFHPEKSGVAGLKFLNNFMSQN